MTLYAVFRGDEQLTSPQLWEDACFDASRIGEGCEVLVANAEIPIALRRTYWSLDEVRAAYPDVRKPGDRHREPVDLPMVRGEQPYDEYQLMKVDVGLVARCAGESREDYRRRQFEYETQGIPFAYRFVLVEQWR